MSLSTSEARGACLRLENTVSELTLVGLQAWTWPLDGRSLKQASSSFPGIVSRLDLHAWSSPDPQPFLSPSFHQHKAHRQPRSSALLSYDNVDQHLSQLKTSDEKVVKDETVINSTALLA